MIPSAIALAAGYLAMFSRASLICASVCNVRAVLSGYLICRTGSVEAGLQFYNGSLADPSSQYAQKVIAERERLQEAVRRFDRSGARSSV